MVRGVIVEEWWEWKAGGVQEEVTWKLMTWKFAAAVAGMPSGATRRQSMADEAGVTLGRATRHQLPLLRRRNRRLHQGFPYSVIHATNIFVWGTPLSCTALAHHNLRKHPIQIWELSALIGDSCIMTKPRCAWTATGHLVRKNKSVYSISRCFSHLVSRSQIKQNKRVGRGAWGKRSYPKLIIKLLGSVSDENGQKIWSFGELGSR